MRLMPLSMLESGSTLGRDVNIGGRTLLRKGHHLTSNEIRALAIRGIVSVYVEDGETLDAEPRGTISELTRKMAVDALVDVFNHTDDLGAARLEAIKTVATQMVEDIMQNEEVSIQLHDLRTYDNYTYLHSVNVTALTLAVGRDIGIRTEELTTLAIAGLMHDIGKTNLPHELLTKPGAFNKEEIEQVRKHADWGFEILSNKTNTDPIIWAVAHQHHERIDGTGYPNKRTGKQIQHWARMLSVTDIWDALRSQRPYKKAWPADKVIEYLRSPQVKKQLDPVALKSFLKIVVPYPLGVMVKLSTGEIATVMQNNSEYPDRPIVRMTLTSEGRPLKKTEMRDIDLVVESQLSIVETLA